MLKKKHLVCYLVHDMVSLNVSYCYYDDWNIHYLETWILTMTFDRGKMRYAFQEYRL